MMDTWVDLTSKTTSVPTTRSSCSTDWVGGDDQGGDAAPSFDVDFGDDVAANDFLDFAAKSAAAGNGLDGDESRFPFEEPRY